MQLGTRWSKIKKRAEDLICTALRDRIEYRMTAYNKTHDHTGRGFITLDKEEILNACYMKWSVTVNKRALEMRQANRCTDFNDPAQSKGYYEALDDSYELAERQGIYSSGEYWQALCTYLNLSIEEALVSENSLIRGCAMIDKRLGKRRLRAFTAQQVEHPFVQKMYELRCSVEGIQPVTD